MSVTFKELAGSPVEIHQSGATTAQRQLLCAWEDRQALVAELLGAENRAPFPGCPGLVAVRVRVEPFEAKPDHQGAFDAIDTHLNCYTGQFALLAADYELLAVPPGAALPSVEPGTLLRYRVESSGYQHNFPVHSLHWQSDSQIPVPSNTAASVFVPILDHYLEWHGVTDPPWNAIRANSGCVNAEGFLGAAAETLLLEGVRVEPEFLLPDDGPAQQSSWKITYLLKEKTVKDSSGTIRGWNDTYRSLPTNNPGFDRLVDAGGFPLYRTVDFAALFFYEGSAP